MSLLTAARPPFFLQESSYSVWTSLILKSLKPDSKCFQLSATSATFVPPGVTSCLSFYLLASSHCQSHADCSVSLAVWNKSIRAKKAGLNYLWSHEGSFMPSVCHVSASSSSSSSRRSLTACSCRGDRKHVTVTVHTHPAAARHVSVCAHICFLSLKMSGLLNKLFVFASAHPSHLHYTEVTSSKSSLE